MRVSSAKRLGVPRAPGNAERGGTRVIVLLLGLCLLGIAAGAFWLYSTSNRGPAPAEGQAPSTPASPLTDTTRAVLARLKSPLEIRFYALLDPATVPDPVTAFAGRVGQLLSAYQQEAGGKIKVTSFNSLSTPSANAALADGIAVFNLDKGAGCYLGVALVLNGRKETLPHLAPDWEQALEPESASAPSPA